MDKRKYELMEAVLKGDLTTVDLIDRIVELEEKEYKISTQPVHEVKDYIIGSRKDAADVLKALEEAADKYETVSIGDYYDLLGMGSKWDDYTYGWSLETIRRAYIIPVRQGFRIIFRPVQLL